MLLGVSINKKKNQTNKNISSSQELFEKSQTCKSEVRGTVCKILQSSDQILDFSILTHPAAFTSPGEDANNHHKITDPHSVT